MDLHGPSAESLAALVDDLSVDGERATTVGSDLFSVAATLRTEGGLRRFLTDGSLPDEARTGLVDQVFGAKVDAATKSVLTSSVKRRWTSAGDLPKALEHLGVVAVVRSAGTGAAGAGRLADELFGLAQLVTVHPDLRNALSDPARSTADKVALVGSLLEGKVLPATLALAAQALTGTYRTVSAALEEFQKVAARTAGEGVATVHVARALSPDEQRRLGDVLSKQYGQPVHLNVLVDPDLIGGIRVEIGDDVIDGTVSSRLDEARRRLAG